MNVTQRAKKIERLRDQLRELEVEQVAEIEAHKDDPTWWGEPANGRAIDGRELAVVYSVRIPPSLVARIRDVADFHGVTNSEYVRRLLVQAHEPAVRVLTSTSHATESEVDHAAQD